MISGRSYYSPGASGTEVSGGGDAGAYLQALLARETQQQDRARKMAGAAAQPRRTMGAAPPAPSRSTPGPRAPSHLEQMAERDAILQMQARQNPAPMRMVSGPQIIPGMTMDTNAMNAYQREAYLPKAAHADYAPREAPTPASMAWEALMASRFDREGGPTGSEDPRRGHRMTTGTSRFTAPRR